jgi:hypothetical protein
MPLDGDLLRLLQVFWQIRSDHCHAVFAHAPPKRWLSGRMDRFFKEIDTPLLSKSLHEVLWTLMHEIPSEMGKADCRWNAVVTRRTWCSIHEPETAWLDLVAIRTFIIRHGYNSKCQGWWTCEERVALLSVPVRANPAHGRNLIGVQGPSGVTVRH